MDTADFLWRGVTPDSNHSPQRVDIAGSQGFHPTESWFPPGPSLPSAGIDDSRDN